MLIFACMVAFASAFVSLRYYLRWHNGKTFVRIATVLTMLYAGVIHLLVVIGVLDPLTYGSIWIRPLLPLLYAISIGDVLVDWREKQVVLNEHLERELSPLWKGGNEAPDDTTKSR